MEDVLAKQRHYIHGDISSTHGVYCAKCDRFWPNATHLVQSDMGCAEGGPQRAVRDYRHFMENKVGKDIIGVDGRTGPAFRPPNAPNVFLRTGEHLWEDPFHLAKIAYAAYGKSVDFKNYQGLPMPEWDDLTGAIQEAWRMAAQAVGEEVYETW